MSDQRSSNVCTQRHVCMHVRVRILCISITLHQLYTIGIITLPIYRGGKLMYGQVRKYVRKTLQAQTPASSTKSGLLLGVFRILPVYICSLVSLASLF